MDIKDKEYFIKVYYRINESEFNDMVISLIKIKELSPNENIFLNVVRDIKDDTQNGLKNIADFLNSLIYLNYIEKINKVVVNSNLNITNLIYEIEFKNIMYIMYMIENDIDEKTNSRRNKKYKNIKKIVYIIILHVFCKVLIIR